MKMVSVGGCDCCFVITVFLLFGVFLQLRRLLSLTRSPPDKEALFRSIKTPSSSSSPSSSVGKVETSSLSVLWKSVCVSDLRLAVLLVIPPVNLGLHR